MKAAPQISLALAFAAVSAMISCYMAMRQFNSDSAQAPSRLVPMARKFSVAVVDIDRVWRNNPKARFYGAELNEKKARAHGKWDQLSRSNGAVAAERFRVSQSAELKALEEKQRSEVVADIMREVASMANGRFDLVFDRSGKCLNTIPFLLVGDGATDITDDVIGRLATPPKSVMAGRPEVGRAP